MSGLQIQAHAAPPMHWFSGTSLVVSVAFGAFMFILGVFLQSLSRHEPGESIGMSLVAGVVSFFIGQGIGYVVHSAKTAPMTLAQGTLTPQSAASDLLMRVIQHRQSLGFPSVLDPQAPTVSVSAALQAVTLHQSLSHRPWTSAAYALAPATWNWSVSQRDLAWHQSPEQALSHEVAWDFSAVTAQWYAHTVHTTQFYHDHTLSVEIIPLTGHQANTVEATLPSYNAHTPWETHFHQMALYVLWARP